MKTIKEMENFFEDFDIDLSFINEIDKDTVINKENSIEKLFSEIEKFKEKEKRNETGR